MAKETEIVLYNPNESVNIEVRLGEETVWLTQLQMAELFGCSSDNIGFHLKNIYKEQELDEISTTEDFSVVRVEGTRKVLRTIKHYNIDAILSVGYRVSSRNATMFRQWATKVLKNYLIKGYALEPKLVLMEEKLEKHTELLKKHDEQIQFFIKSATPIAEKVFMDGEFYDAFALVQKLIKSAKKSIILIDNYVDESVLTRMSEKSDGVSVSIYTKSISKAMELAAENFNSQYGGLKLKRFADCHDRFLILDDSEMYLFGASLKDLGKKMFAFTKLDNSSIALVMSRIKDI
ncbi:MAG: virulence RhuM family protein [Bacteroidales bacterium]|nr:virulence RhuM family protein [Bacteroidales bacterium]